MLDGRADACQLRNSRGRIFDGLHGQCGSLAQYAHRIGPPSLFGFRETSPLLAEKFADVFERSADVLDPVLNLLAIEA